MRSSSATLSTGLPTLPQRASTLKSRLSAVIFRKKSKISYKKIKDNTYLCRVLRDILHRKRLACPPGLNLDNSNRGAVKQALALAIRWPSGHAIAKCEPSPSTPTPKAVQSQSGGEVKMAHTFFFVVVRVGRRRRQT